MRPLIIISPIFSEFQPFICYYGLMFITNPSIFSMIHFILILIIHFFKFSFFSQLVSYNILKSLLLFSSFYGFNPFVLFTTNLFPFYYLLSPYISFIYQIHCNFLKMDKVFTSTILYIVHPKALAISYHCKNIHNQTF